MQPERLLRVLSEGWGDLKDLKESRKSAAVNAVADMADVQLKDAVNQLVIQGNLQEL